MQQLIVRRDHIQHALLRRFVLRDRRAELFLFDERLPDSLLPRFGLNAHLHRHVRDRHTPPSVLRERRQVAVRSLFKPSICLPINDIVEHKLQSLQSGTILPTISGVSKMVPIADSMNRFVATTGHGASGRLCTVSLGIQCNIQEVLSPIKLVSDDMYYRLYSLPSLEDDFVDPLAIFSTTNRSYLISISGNGHFEVIKSSDFSTLEKTLNTGVYNGVYVQITPSQVRFLQEMKCVAEWKCGSDSQIGSSFIGANYITVITGNNIRCLKLVHDQPNEFRIVELEAKVVNSEIDDVLEYGNYLFFAVRDRSIRRFEIVGNVLEARDPIAVDCNPSCIYSFSNVRNPNYQQYASPNDSLLYVGAHGGNLLLIALNGDAEPKKIYEVQISSEPVCFSPCILSGVPALVVSAGDSYYVIYRNNPFRLIPMLINFNSTMLLDKNASTSHMGNLFVSRQKSKSLFLMWQKKQLIYLDIDTRSTSISIQPTELGVTPRLLVPSLNGTVFVSGYDVNKQSSPPQIASSRFSIIQFNKDFGLLQSSRGVSIPLDEAISASLFIPGKANELLLLLASFNGVTSKYYLRAYRYSVESQSGFSPFPRLEIALKSEADAPVQLWEVRFEYKIFFLLPVADRFVAVVTGNELQIYEIDLYGPKFVSHIRVGVVSLLFNSRSAPTPSSPPSSSIRTCSISPITRA